MRVNKRREGLVEEYIEEIFYIEDKGRNKGKLRLFSRGKSVVVDSVWKVYYDTRRKKGWLFDTEEEFKGEFIVGVLEGLHKKEELLDIRYYLDGKEGINSLEGYLISFFKGYVNINVNKGEEYRKIQGKYRVVRRLSDSIDYTYSDGGTYGDMVGEFIQDKEGYGTVNNEKYNVLMNERGSILTDNQNMIYDKFKDSFTTETDDFNDWGYDNQEDFVESSGVTLSSYKSFIKYTRKRALKLEDELKGEVMLENKLKEFQNILDREDISDKVCQLLINKSISKNYGDEDYEVTIVKGLSTKDKISVVRMVKEFKGIKPYLLEDVESKEYKLYENKVLSKSIMYKIINNVLDKLEELEEEVVIRNVEDFGDKNKPQGRRVLGDEDKVVYVTSHGAVIPSSEVEGYL